MVPAAAADVGAWLDSVSPDLSRLEPCFARAGYRGVDDLVAHGPTRAELEALLKVSNSPTTPTTSVVSKPDVGRVAAALFKLRFPRYDGGLAELTTWLDSVKPGFSLFAEAMQCAGYLDVEDLREYPPPIAELTEVLSRAGAERPQVARVADALATLRRSQRGSDSQASSLRDMSPVALTADSTASSFVQPLAPLRTHDTTTTNANAAAIAAVPAKPSPASTPARPLTTSTPATSVASTASDGTPTVSREASSGFDAPPAQSAVGTVARHASSGVHPNTSGEVRACAAPRPSKRSREAPNLEMVFKGKHAMLSYQWDHQAQVLRARQMLESMGVPCWIDVDHMVSLSHSAGQCRGCGCMLASVRARRGVCCSVRQLQHRVVNLLTMTRQGKAYGGSTQ
jgi:hypothetical protein